ncbi:MAG: efflux RND transporter periplasmic adaptor subunit [Putridiphycobacter sp.]
MKTLKIIILSAVTIGVIVSCGNSTSINEAHDHEHAHGNEVFLSAQQMNTVGVEIGAIEQKNIGAIIKINGSLEVPPQAKADISPVKGGIVKRINVIEGDVVKKGQVLAVLQHPDLIDLQTEYSANYHELQYIEKEYLRQKELHAEKIISNKVFEKIESEYHSLQSKVLALKTQLQIIGIHVKGVEEGKIYPSINVTSPFNGVVSSVETNIGAYAEPMTKLLEVVNTKDMHADFMVYEKDVDKVAVGQKIEFSTLNSQKMYEAEIHNISPVFENDPKAIHLHADILSEKSHLVPGLFLSGNLHVNDYLNNVVPDDAIVEDKGKFYVFVWENFDDSSQKNIFIKTEIIKGTTANGYTEISFLTDIESDTKIAVSGAYYILSELTKEEQEHDH